MTNNEVKITNEEINLEDLIILGDDKKIPITIEFPKNDGQMVKAQAYVKQLTLKELDNVKLKGNNLVEANLIVLEKSLLKQDGSNFNKDEIMSLPIGVVNAIAEKIMELSGVNETINKQLMDF